MSELGIIGLGKMGYRIAERLLEQKYSIIANDIDKDLINKIEKKGATGADSYEKLIRKLSKPRIILLSVPSNKLNKSVLNLEKKLSKKDIIIDAGNSSYKDSMKHAERFKTKDIYFLDVGVSGGIYGARNGSCLMIGGNKKAFESIEHLFKALSDGDSYRYLGKSGSGHLAKGIHNLIEYGYLQALAEGLTGIKAISGEENLDISLKDICRIWNKGSIIESKLLEYAEKALDNDISNISGSVHGQSQKEMELILKEIKKAKESAPCCEKAMKERKKSQKKPTFQGKITNAKRNVFGGHKEWEK